MPKATLSHCICCVLPLSVYLCVCACVRVCPQSKHQKHQAFEAELHANADRIRGVIDTGNALIQRGACSGSEDAVKVRAATTATALTAITS